MLYLRFSFQVLHFCSSRREGMLVLTMHIWNARWTPGHCSPRNYSCPCISSTSAQKRSLRAQIMLLVLTRGVHPPKGGTSCGYGIYLSCTHPTPNWELHGCSQQEFAFSSGFSPCTPSLFFWLSLTQLQLLQFNLFLHKGPGVDTLISRGCFQRCLVAFSPGSI